MWYRRLKNTAPNIMSHPLHKFSDLELAALEEQCQEVLKYNRIFAYEPYPKQLDFHTAGLNFPERLLLAGNQLGKTYCGAGEVSYHLTGLYPDWWSGRRFDKPVKAWAGGVTNITTRDTVQMHLLGDLRNRDLLGTGAIPRSHLDVSKISWARGIPDAVDTAFVRHVSGGESVIQFKSYEQGREKWQAATLDFVWFDEEPPTEIYAEGKTRTNATGGMVFLTFTPLEGITEVVRQFLYDINPYRNTTVMTIDDALHYSASEKQRILASYQPWELEARAFGRPILGSGKIFPIARDVIACEPFTFPNHFAQINGIDIGWDHPTAAVNLGYDRDSDIVYVAKTFRRKESTPMQIAPSLLEWGAWIPWAWPHDALQHDKNAGYQTSQLYSDHGLKMLPERATWPDGSNSVEAGVIDMLERMQSGRLKVFNTCDDWFQEMDLFHRKNGQIVKINDDLLSATRYAIMMLRYALTEPEKKRPIQGRFTHPRARGTAWMS